MSPNFPACRTQTVAVASTAGWWLWPGEALAVPGISGGEAGGQVKDIIKRAGASNPQLSAGIAGQATEFTYTDVASGQSDSMSISLENIGKEWMGRLMPKRSSYRSSSSPRYIKP